MNVRTIAGFWLAAVVFAGAVACRHLGMIDEPDAGPGPHCDPCAEYQIRVNACLKPACEGMQCDVCEYQVSRLKDPSCGEASDGGTSFDGTLEIGPDPDIDAGSCSGSEREEAFQKLKWFTCDDDEYVSGTLDAIERDCVPAKKTCLAVGAACEGGYCYYVGTSEDPQCMSPGSRVVGESCSTANECAAGAQCLDAGDMVCWEVCDSYMDCNGDSDCVDTELGFSVCVAAYE